MATIPQGKYQLKSLHAEIDLFDRKLAHLLRYESFANDSDRDDAARRITLKRDQLVRTARQMAESGVEFSPSELPRSFRTEPMSQTPPETAQAESVPVAPVVRKSRASRQSSPYASTALDFRTALAEYKQKKKKA